MSKLQTRLAATAAAMVMVGGLAACGGDEDDVAAPPAATETQAPETAAPEEASALVPVEYADPFAGAREAAGHMPMTATALATGFAEANDIEGADTDAAQLRADLTYLLSEHVYLAGLGINTALVAGPTDPKTEAALATLDENSVALADAVGTVADDEQREAFLTAWRDHINDFVAYATAEDDAGREDALANLDAYRTAAGELLATITGDAVGAEAVASELETHVDSLIETIDAMVAGDTEAYELLYAAAGHMPMTAAALAGAFAEAGDVAGDTASEGADLRAGLTGLLTGHVYMAGTAVFTAYTADGGAEGEAFTAAAEALGQNTADLTAAVASVAPDVEEDFNTAWAAHIDDFVMYAVGAAESDTAMKQAALANLDAYRESAGALFEEASDGAISADAVAESLSTHVETLAGTIDALAAALVTT